MKFQNQTLRIGGVPLRVMTAGKSRPGGPPPLLMLNGIGFNAELMQPLARALVTAENGAIENRAIIIPDMPGCGHSPDPAGHMLMYRLARIMGQMMAELHPGECYDCVGFSWGGALAQQMAVQSSRGIQRLALISTTSGLPVAPANPDVVKRLFDPEEYANPARLAENFQALLEEGGAGAGLMTRFRTPTPHGVGNQLLALTGWTAAPLLPFVRVPVALVGVVDDAVVPFAHHHMLSCLIPHAELIHVGSGGHLVSLAQPDRVAPQLRQFLLAEAPPVPA